MDTSYYAKDKNNIPILSQDQIDNIAEMELKKFQKQALTRPTAIDIDGFLEMHLHVTPDYQYLSHNMVYLGMSVFYDTNAIPIYDEIAGRAEYLSVKANTVIFDRRLVENKSQEHRYRFTGGHEAGHFVLHSSYYRRNRVLGKSDNLFAKCHTISLCGMKKGNLVTDLQIKVKPQDKKWHDKKAASNLKKRSSLMKRCVETLRRIQNLVHFGIVY